jgi:hypothetical protein
VATADDGHGLAEGDDDVPLAAADNNSLVGLHLARVVEEFHDGRAVGGEAEELGRDLGVFLLAVVGAEGLSVVRGGMVSILSHMISGL